MYISQECLLSFDEIIKYQPKTKLGLILAELDFSDIHIEILNLGKSFIINKPQLKDVTLN